MIPDLLELESHTNLYVIMIKDNRYFMLKSCGEFVCVAFQAHKLGVKVCTGRAPASIFAKYELVSEEDFLKIV